MTRGEHGDNAAKHQSQSNITVACGAGGRKVDPAEGYGARALAPERVSARRESAHRAEGEKGKGDTGEGKSGWSSGQRTALVHVTTMPRFRPLQLHAKPPNL